MSVFIHILYGINEEVVFEPVTTHCLHRIVRESPLQLTGRRDSNRVYVYLYIFFYNLYRGMVDRKDAL